MKRLLAARRLTKGFLRKAKDALGRNRRADADSMTDEYMRFWRSISTASGAEFHPLTDEIWEIRRAETKTWIGGSYLQFDDPVRLRAAADKLFTYKLAENLGLPVPRHRRFTLSSLDDARSFMRANAPGPFVVKPARGTAAAGGVTTRVGDRNLVRAAVLAATYDTDLIVESMIHGETYRLLFMDGELLHCVRRRGLCLYGDGETTVLRLLHKAGVSRPEADPSIGDTLRRQGLGWSTVVPAGQRVVASGVPSSVGPTEPRTVYDEVIDALPEPLVADAGALVQALGLELAGVDVVSADTGRWPDRSSGVLLEVNGTPALHHHFVPADEAEGVALGARILERLLSRSP